MNQVLGYARVSTHDQNTQSQLDQLREAGCEKLFVDHASGKDTRNRTDLGRLLEHMRKGDVVVVTRLDRLSRSLTDLLNLVDRLGKEGVEFRSLKENFDTSTIGGKLFFQFTGMMAEYERARIRERTLEGLEAARARGRVGGRPRRLTEEQERMISRLRQEGESTREIARIYNVSVGTISRALARHKHTTDEED